MLTDHDACCCGPHQQGGDWWQFIESMVPDPPEKTGRIAKIIRIDAARTSDVAAGADTAMESLHLLGREIGEDCPVHKHVLSINHRGQNTGNGDGGTQCIAQASAAMDKGPAIREIRGNTEEGPRQIGDFNIRNVLSAGHRLVCRAPGRLPAIASRRGGWIKQRLPLPVQPALPASIPVPRRQQ